MVMFLNGIYKRVDKELNIKKMLISWREFPKHNCHLLFKILSFIIHYSKKSRISIGKIILAKF